MKQSQVFAKRLLRPALAVLVMGALAACGSGPGANPSGPENVGPLGSDLGDNSQSSVQLPVTTVPSASATIAPEIVPGGAVVEAKAEPAGPANTDSAAVAIPRRRDKIAPSLDLSDRKEARVDLGQYRQLLPKDAIAPIYEPRFLTAEKAGLDPGELVIGVELNGESKAYPIGPLVRREMVNDTVGGVPILVTW